MKFRIRQTTNKEIVFNLSDALFGSDLKYDHSKNVYWLAFDQNNNPVGFAQATPTGFGEVFLSRSGVLKCARGYDLQVRLIKVREAWARKNGYTALVTYAIRSNGPSIKSLLKCGFKIYEPSWEWGSSQMVYFSKDISDEHISLPKKL